jgi:hypothetical protein
MVASAEQNAEAARRRKANQRAREKGFPEPYPKGPLVDKAEKTQREKDHIQNFAWAEEQDATGRFYKSECRSTLALLAIYEGNNQVGVEDPEVIDTRTGKKKQNIPNPSIQAIRIRATEVDGIKIDPDMLEYKSVYEVNHIVSFRDWLDLRDKARKDLFWLARLLGLGFYHDTHQIMCDMFVKKNFDGLYFPEFNRDDVSEMLGRQERFTTAIVDGKPQQIPTRTLLLFAPRSSYKSTADGADSVQWMLNAPDVRILIMTSVLRLSKELMTEIKRYFYLPPRGQPSSFQLLFPEYILTGVDGRSKEAMVCPAQNFTSKEPHLWVTSLDASFVGSRCDIRKIDDAVEDKNSANDELREALKQKLIATGALIEPWGFTDVIGTRYFTTDWYGWRMGQVRDEGSEEKDFTEPFVYLSISAWTPKPGFETTYSLLLDAPGGVFKITEDMVDMFFPKKLSFKVLRTKLREYKERGFKNQYLNIATDPLDVEDFIVHFDKSVLRSHTYGAAAAPTSGEKLVCIDWAYSENKTSDYSVLAAILRHEREDTTQELVVLDIDYDKWKSSVLAEKIVLFLRTHRPVITLMEKALGADLLYMALETYAAKYNCREVLSTIRWVPTGNSLNEKANRVKNLEILLSDDRLHFVSGPWIDELYRQFERFTGETKKGRKDDIPDAISTATRRLPPSMFRGNLPPDPEEEKRAQEEQQKEYLKARHYNMYFGEQSYSGTRSHARNTPAPPTTHAPKLTQWRQGYRGDSPAPAPEPEPEPPKPLDPRMRIFGNKGPWRL